MIRRSVFAVAIFLAATPSVVANAWPVLTLAGSYNVTFFLEPELRVGATQCVVFTKTGSVLGEPLSGTWVSPTFPGWQGHWVERGDAFKWFGISNGVIATAEFGNFVSRGSNTGEFAHFFTSSKDSASSGGYFSMSRVASCPTSSTAAPFSADPAE